MWPVGSPEWVEDMRAARVPWVAGMRSASGFRVISCASDGVIMQASVEGSGEVALFLNGEPKRHALPSEHVAGWIPDISDRATALLCLDEAEKRGIRELFDEYGAYFASIDAGDARALYMWADDLARPLLLAALARALRETAPGGGR
jgi:hypothetical protein